MSVKLRLARIGSKKNPIYRVVAADSRSPRDGRFIEKLGTYNPMVQKGHPDRVRLNAERIKASEQAQAQAEERVREAILDNMSQGMVLFDRDDRLVIANKYFRELYPALAEFARRDRRFGGVSPSDNAARAVLTDAAPFVLGAKAANAG